MWFTHVENRFSQIDFFQNRKNFRKKNLFSQENFLAKRNFVKIWTKLFQQWIEIVFFLFSQVHTLKVIHFRWYFHFRLKASHHFQIFCFVFVFQIFKIKLFFSVKIFMKCYNISDDDDDDAKLNKNTRYISLIINKHWESSPKQSKFERNFVFFFVHFCLIQIQTQTQTNWMKSEKRNEMKWNSNMKKNEDYFGLH